MKNRKVRNFAEFALWTKTRMLERGISQRELAAGMGTHQARISEAITGKPSGKKFIIPLIQELGGQRDSNARALLYALRPYLKPERQEKVGR